MKVQKISNHHKSNIFYYKHYYVVVLYTHTYLKRIASVAWRFLWYNRKREKKCIPLYYTNREIMLYHYHQGVPFIQQWSMGMGNQKSIFWGGEAFQIL